MKKRLVAVLLMVVVLMIAACGNSNSEEESIGADSQIMENTDPAETRLIMEKVEELSEKGEALTWSDFEQYENSGDIGSGLYVIRYDMEESYYVLVGGADMETFPMYIRLVSTENPDNYIDIRTESIGDFAISQMTENTDPVDIQETISTEGVADYPAVIMVNDTIYLLEGVPMPVEVDESAIIGYTESFTDTFPENNGETNFNPELGMPYAQVEGGIAVLYQNEWYLCTPFSNTASEITITYTEEE